MTYTERDLAAAIAVCKKVHVGYVDGPELVAEIIAAHVQAETAKANEWQDGAMVLLFDGGGWPEDVKPQDMDWKNGWWDEGPSPAGNKGPYLKVPCPKHGTVYRLYFEPAPPVQDNQGSGENA